MNTATLAPIYINQPGLYEMSSAQYHADPVAGGSLTSSGARTILRSPAHFRQQLLNPKPATDEQLFGSAVHRLVLGAGEELEIIFADNYRAKAAQQARDQALAAGRIPILSSKYAIALEMADVVHAHPEAASLMAGKAEQVLVWRRSGIWCRAMIDSLLPDGAADYKTTTSCELHKLARTFYDYRYHQQQAWYVDGLKALGVTNAPQPRFHFVCQEKEVPYAVRVIELHIEDAMLGEEENSRARGLYRDCRALDEWPAYPNHPAVITLPRYARKDLPSC